MESNKATLFSRSSFICGCSCGGLFGLRVIHQFIKTAAGLPLTCTDIFGGFVASKSNSTLISKSPGLNPPLHFFTQSSALRLCHQIWPTQASLFIKASHASASSHCSLKNSSVGRGPIG